MIVSHTIFSEPEVLKLESRKKLQTLGHAPPYELYITFHLKYHIGLQTLIHTQRDAERQTEIMIGNYFSPGRKIERASMQKL